MNYNVITEYINFSKICVNKYLKKILGKHYDQELVNRLLIVYVNSRYYDVYLSSGNNFALNIRENLQDTRSAIENNENKEQVDFILEAFEYMFYFDNVLECESINEKIEEIEVFRKERLGINRSKKFSGDLFNMIRDDLIKKKEYIDTIDNKKFDFDYSLTNIRNLYDVVLNQNLKFPIVYNSAVIDSIFKSDELSQRKAMVEYSFAALKVLKDIIKGNFEYKYLVKYPGGISRKKTLHKKLSTMIDNDILKEKVLIKINYDDFLKERDAIYTDMRRGFKYVVILNEDFEDNVDNVKLLSVFKYIIMKKNQSFNGKDRFSNIIYI